MDAYSPANAVDGSRRASLYESEWLRLVLVDVEIPGGESLRASRRADAQSRRGHDRARSDRGVLLLWRHRFITDTWGWEIPAGRIDPGETPPQAAAREALEETGWEPAALRPLVRYQPDERALRPGVPHLHRRRRDASRRSERSRRVGAHRVGRASPTSAELVQDAQMLDGLSLTAVLYALAFGELG